MSNDKTSSEESGKGSESTHETRTFEELLEAALRVDPTGLSGKHKSGVHPCVKKAKKPKK
jgi:hypothetical protein